MQVKVTHAGWFNFEGFGRPFEGWFVSSQGWRTAGRAFTRAGARRKATRRALTAGLVSGVAGKPVYNQGLALESSDQPNTEGGVVR